MLETNSNMESTQNLCVGIFKTVCKTQLLTFISLFACHQRIGIIYVPMAKEKNDSHVSLFLNYSKKSDEIVQVETAFSHVWICLRMGIG